MILKFASIITKNFVAFRKCVITTGLMNTSLYVPQLSTCSVFENKEQSKISYLKDDSDGQLAPDEDYPEWLWTLQRTKYNFTELDYLSKTYNRILRKKQRRDENEKRKMKRF